MLLKTEQSTAEQDRAEDISLDYWIAHLNPLSHYHPEHTQTWGKDSIM